MTVRLTLVSVALGGVYGLSRNGVPGLAGGMINGLVIGGILSTCEVFFVEAPVGARLRRLPVGIAFALKIALYTAVILPGLHTGARVSAWLGDRHGPELAADVAFSFTAAAIVNTVLIVRRLIGPTLIALI